MKTTPMAWSVVCSMSLVGSLLLSSGPTQAGTVAYWRFEEGPADSQMVHHSGANGVWSADVADSSGNGNALSVWTSESFAGYGYRSDVPFQVTDKGEINRYSVKNTGGLPGMWNESLAGWTPEQFTIEASFKPENGGWRTIVGRDSRGAGTQGGADGNAASLYFQLQPGNRVAITFQDVAGYSHTARSEENAVVGFDWPTDPDGLLGRWYSMSGVSDGKTLSLFLNDLAAGTGYQLVAQTDLTLSGSANTAFTPGLGSGSDWSAGNFSVGRGMYNGGHGDRAYGYIDEVRLTDGALSVDQFVHGTAVPEPGTLTLAALGGLAALIRRRKSA